MRFIPGIALALLLAFSFTGCSLLHKDKKKKKAKPQPELQADIVGIVDMVNPEQNYVLIRCDQQPAFSTGTELYSVDATGAQSKLVVTPEHKGYYVTADIKSGSPHVANQVVRKQAATSTKTAATTAAKPATVTPTLPPIPSPPIAPTEPALPQAGATNGAATPTLEPVVR